MVIHLWGIGTGTSAKTCDHFCETTYMEGASNMEGTSDDHIWKGLVEWGEGICGVRVSGVRVCME